MSGVGESAIGTVLVVVPALDEEARIGAVLDRVRATTGLDVLVVDDGSTDGTAACARAHGARVVSHAFNLGYGAALQTGYRVADRGGYAAVVQLDADGQHDPADVPALLAPLAAGTADLVIGSRFLHPSGYRMGTARATGRAVLQRLLVACGGPRLTDPTSGFQALDRRAFRLCCESFYPADFPDVDVLLHLHRRGIRIREVAVEMAPSPPGRASMHAGLRGVYYPYKMLLATLRSALAPRPVAGSVELRDRPRDPREARP